MLALGANLGNRRESFERACRMLDRHGAHVQRRSRLYWTRPLGGRAQPPYLNAAVCVATALRPLELMWRCQAIEREMGRVRREPWQSRAIDLDIIFFGAQRVDHRELTAPHPSWKARDFVLRPLQDLSVAAPGLSWAETAKLIHARLQEVECTVESSTEWP